jgi:hypothetical protein
MTTFDVEMTDTFGGEANYAWVRRDTIALRSGASGRAIARAAKRAMGMSGARGRSHWDGDVYEFRPYGACLVLFALYRDPA